MRALTQQRSQWRQGELWLLFLALTLAIFACYGLSAAGSLMQRSLLKSSAELMGADRILSATRQAEPEWLQQAREQQLTLSEQWGFNSMVFVGDEDDSAMQLVAAKAVDQNYPVKGELQIETLSGIATERPEEDQVYLDKRLKELLKVELGDSLELGYATFTVAGWVAQEPDAGLSLWGNLPTLILRLEDVAKSRVVQPGSRIWYRYLLSGETESLKRYDEWLKPQLSSIYRYRGIEQQGGRLASTLKRNETVLKLAGLLTALLSLAAIAVISQYFMEQQQKEVALLKSLGVSRKELGYRYAALVLQILSASSFLGLLLAHFSLHGLAILFAEQLTQLKIEWEPAAIGLSLISCAGGALIFIWRPLLVLLSTPAALLIQGQQKQVDKTPYGWTLLLVVFFATLLLLFSGSVQLGAALFVVAIAAIVLVYWVSQAVIRLFSRLLSQRSLAFAMACRNLIRRHYQNRLLLSGFTLAGLLALSIFYLRHDLIEQWREQLPDGSANHFALNIQPNQKEALLSWLGQNRIEVSHLYPVIRGRLAQINGEPVQERVEELENGSRRYISRELNLTYRAELPEGNELLDGKFLDDSQSVSIESGMAERLELNVGDSVTFDIAGQLVTAKISSIRKVNWNSMRPNFFMILSPELLNSFSASYLASFYLPPENDSVSNQLTQAFPTLTMLNVEVIIKRFEKVITHSSYALTVILILVLLATALLLFAQIRAGLAARQQELVTMQTLGATRRLLGRITLFEFALLGMVAGVIAVVMTEILLALLFEWVLDLSASFHPLLWVIAPLGGGVLVSLLGWFGCRHLLREGALSRLRRLSGG